MSSAVLGIGSELVVEGLDRLFKLVEPEVRESKVEVHFRVMRSFLEGFLENLDRLREFEFRLTEDTQTLQSLRLIRKCSQSLPVDLFRSGVVLALFEFSGLGEKASQRRGQGL